MADIKKRFWTAVVYPDSAPSDWEQIISDSGLPWAHSPLHDKDLNADEVEKKPHWHIVLCFNGPTTFKSVTKLLEPINCPIPKPLESIRGMYRYFTHKDNPEKYQYDEKDNKHFNGFNVQDFFELTKSEVHALIVQLCEMIDQEGFTEYDDVEIFLRINQMMDLHDVFCSHTILFTAKLRSKRYKAMYQSKSIGESNRDLEELMNDEEEVREVFNE